MTATTLMVQREGSARLAISLAADGTPIDLFPDPLDRPDPTGAIVRGRVTRRFDGGAAEASVPSSIAPEGLVRLDRLSKTLKPGDPLILEITGAPPAPKRPSATALPTLVGRTVAFQPFGKPGLSVSKRMAGSDTQTLTQALRPPERGTLVLRQAALDHPNDAVAAEAEGLIHAATPLFAAGEEPAILLEPPSPWRRLATAQPDLKDLSATASDHRSIARSLATLPIPGLKLSAVSPPIGLDWLDTHLSTIVALPGGGRLTIQPTAALTAIDVDTGDRTAGQVNPAAAQQIAREIRLRNLSGLILVDFAGYSGPEVAADLIKTLGRELSGDPATLNLGRRFSPLGLWECARQRRAPALSEVL